MRFWVVLTYDGENTPPGGIVLAIGIYDSGLGGLSVWRELRQSTKARLLYFGDTSHVPYGEKTQAQLEGYFWEIVGFFLTKGCQAVVVACNTSSALVVPRVAGKVDIPVFGIIERAVDAVLEVSDGRVGVLATRATAESGAYQRAFAEAAPDTKVFVQSAPKLVPLVEAGEINSDLTRQALKEYIDPLLAENIDTLLLGCTHYPFLRESIAELAGPAVRIVDPAPALAVQVGEMFPAWQADQLGKAASCDTQFWVSGDPQTFKTTAELLLKEELPAVGFYHMSGEKV